MNKSLLSTNPGTWLAVLVTAGLLLTGCGSIQVAPVSPTELIERSTADRVVAQTDVEPLKGVLTLEEAIARALKYNLDARARLIEQAIALNQLDLSNYDMLPKLVASAGYHDNDKYRITRSTDSITGQPPPGNSNPYISADRTHTVSGLGLSWSLLDFGLSYYGAKQQADRVMIASERRRKAIHTLIQDVRAAFWRVAAAQKLQGQIRATLLQAEDALAESRRIEAERLRSPLESLRYQRQLLENLRLLETIDQELSTARYELSSLVNLPLATDLVVAEPNDLLDEAIMAQPVERLEAVAIANNADLREQFYNSRIAQEETRKALVRMFPGISFNYDLKHDNDSYLIHQNWREAGVQLSFNLFNLLTGPAQQKLAEAGVALADQRRVATQMALLAQVHIARLQYANARRLFNRSDSIWQVDDKISHHIENQERAQTQSRQERIANHTTAILSLLRRYQALAQAHTAAGKLQATLGLEPRIASLRDASLPELTEAVATSLRSWQTSTTAAPAAPAVPAAAPTTSAPPAEPTPATATEATVPETPPLAAPSLADLVREIHRQNPRFGSRRIALVLSGRGIAAERAEVRKLMTAMHLRIAPEPQ